MTQEFQKWPSIGRLNRDAVTTEKLDGTNAAVVITENGDFFTQSRNRIITEADDNAGFAKWAYANRESLEFLLGVGRHFGEWFGQGIQRNYGLSEKRFALFNVNRWEDADFSELPQLTVVPVLDVSPFNTANIEQVKQSLKDNGSVAVPGFMNPEGIVIYHTAAKATFKSTFDECDRSGAQGGKTWTV